MGRTWLDFEAGQRLDRPGIALGQCVAPCFLQGDICSALFHIVADVCARFAGT